MKIAGLVGTMNIHGGVRRYFELGNAFVKAGHDYTLYCDMLQESKPWMEFNGNIKKLSEFSGTEEFDIILTGDHFCFNKLVSSSIPIKIVMVVAKFYAHKYLELWDRYGTELKWIGVASGWNLGMERIAGVCIPGGVNTTFFTPIDNKHNTGRLRIGFYARLGDGRGVDKIFQLVHQLGECEFIGFDAGGYDTVQKNVAPNVFIARTDSQDALRSVYRQCNVIVSCMRSAGWNNVVAEGMACGCVPIASPAGTADTVINDVTGYIYGYEQFHNAVNRIKTLACNRTLLNTLSHACINHVQKFNWDSIASNIINRLETGGNFVQ
jgi:glycosyltransferase involved in cell wall biosynthesis